MNHHILSQEDGKFQEILSQNQVKTNVNRNIHVSFVNEAGAKKGNILEKLPFFVNFFCEFIVWQKFMGLQKKRIKIVT